MAFVCRKPSFLGELGLVLRRKIAAAVAKAQNLREKVFFTPYLLIS